MSALSLVLAVFTLTGFNFAFWGIMSTLRLLYERVNVFSSAKTFFSSQAIHTRSFSPDLKSVAVIMAARNEEVSIAQTLTALCKIIAPSQIFVGSDASTDRTADIVRSFGCNVIEFKLNRGKPRVIVRLMRRFNIMRRFKFVTILDADVIADPHFFIRGLRYFSDPNVAAVVGHAVSKWYNHFPPRWSMLCTAYRVRTWRILQYTMRYGQTWKYTNLTSIIPGGSSMYRSSVLLQIKIDERGLAVEDFNMTFEVHRKKLGTIAYSPSVFVIDQEPYRLRDYIRQIKRWNLGFWQTMRRHGFWPSFFWLATFLFEVELFFYATFILLIPLFLVLLINNSWQPITLHWLQVFALGSATLSLSNLIIGVLLIDYILTGIVAWIERKPILFIYGLVFFILRYIDAAVYVWTLLLAFLPLESSGRWISPQRRA